MLLINHIACTSYRLCEVQDDLARSAHDAAGLLLDLDDQIQSQHQALPGVSPQEPGGENNLVSLKEAVRDTS